MICQKFVSSKIQFFPFFEKFFDFSKSLIFLDKLIKANTLLDSLKRMEQRRKRKKAQANNSGFRKKAVAFQIQGDQSPRKRTTPKARLGDDLTNSNGSGFSRKRSRRVTKAPGLQKRSMAFKKQETDGTEAPSIKGGTRQSPSNQKSQKIHKKEKNREIQILEEEPEDLRFSDPNNFDVAKYQQEYSILPIQIYSRKKFVSKVDFKMNTERSHPSLKSKEESHHSHRDGLGNNPLIRPLNNSPKNTQKTNKSQETYSILTNGKYAPMEAIGGGHLTQTADMLGSFDADDFSENSNNGAGDNPYNIAMHLRAEYLQSKNLSKEDIMLKDQIERLSAEIAEFECDRKMGRLYKLISTLVPVEHRIAKKIANSRKNRQKFQNSTTVADFAGRLNTDPSVEEPEQMESEGSKNNTKKNIMDLFREQEGSEASEERSASSSDNLRVSERNTEQASSVRSVATNIHSSELRKRIKTFQLRSIVGALPYLFYGGLILIAVVAVIFKIITDDFIKEFVKSAQKSEQLVAQLVASGKIYRMVMKNRLTLLGMIDIDPPQGLSYDINEFYDLNLGSFEKALYSKQFEEMAFNIIRILFTTEKNYDTWSFKTKAAIVDVETGRMEFEDASLGELSMSNLYACWDFMKTFDPETQLYTDISEIEYQVLATNIGQADLDMYNLFNQIYDDQNQVESFIDLLSIGAVVLFAMLGIILGIILYQIIVQINSARSTVSGFVLRMERKATLMEYFKFAKVCDEADSRRLLKKIKLIKPVDDYRKRYMAMFSNSKKALRMGGTEAGQGDRGKSQRIFSKFQKEQVFSRSKIAGVTILLVILINIPVIINYEATKNIKSHLKQLRQVKKELEIRMSFNNILFAIEYNKFMLLKTDPQAKIAPTLAKLENLTSDRFRENYLLER